MDGTANDECMEVGAHRQPAGWGPGFAPWEGTTGEEAGQPPDDTQAKAVAPTGATRSTPPAEVIMSANDPARRVA